jgi:serine phosphatase RsbU (regulator of sigma subunit)
VSEVGGDFYDALAIDDRRWALVIGDVCGTGPDAAAVTAIAHTIRAAATHGADPPRCSRLNDALHAGNRVSSPSPT